MTDAVKPEPCPLKVDYETSPSHLRAIAGDLHRTSQRYLSDLLCKAADALERRAGLEAVRREEREEAAKVADSEYHNPLHANPAWNAGYQAACTAIAQQIRALS